MKITWLGQAGLLIQTRGIKVMIDPYLSDSVEKINPKNYRRVAVDSRFLEIMYSDVEWRKDVTNEALEYKDGFMKIPDKPGLGIEINEEVCLAHPYQPHTLRHYTGALTDIRPAKTEFYF